MTFFTFVIKYTTFLLLIVPFFGNQKNISLKTRTKDIRKKTEKMKTE